MTLYTVPIGLTPKGPIGGLSGTARSFCGNHARELCWETLKRLENPLPPM